MRSSPDRGLHAAAMIFFSAQTRCARSEAVMFVAFVQVRRLCRVSTVELAKYNASVSIASTPRGPARGGVGVKGAWLADGGTVTGPVDILSSERVS